jgi:multiple sugar transport system permease protein
VLPYLLVFVVFVLYPVGYGLWLARHPDSYVKLAEDPIFFRTAINTIVFLVVAINVKMAVALGLSGFFVQSRWWIKILSALFILPWAVPSIPTILSVRFMLNPEWGVINSTIFTHRAGRPELAERPDAGADLLDADAHLEEPAVLDADPAGRSAGHPH